MSNDQHLVQEKDLFKGPIHFMASHPVAANLLMLVFICGGLFLFSKTTKEVFPEFSLDTITVSMSYPGASPEEIEKAIVLPIENELKDVEGIAEITSMASEGSARVIAEAFEGQDMTQLSADVKTAVDRISTFPVEAENLNVSVNTRRREVVSFALFGDVNEKVLRASAEQILDQLESDKSLGPVEISGAKNYEIHIEVSSENLRKYGLSIPSIASRISQIALELGGGTVKTSAGDVMVRMNERRYRAHEFGNIPVITTENGASIHLKDIATIKETFDDSNNAAFWNGKNAVMFDVYRVGNQTPNSVSEATQKALEEVRTTLPKGLQIEVIDDRSKLFNARAELIMKNGLTGLLLVVILLALFLDIRLAFWVSMGIPISFMGAFLLFPATDFTVNIISMFAFLIALGIVVDDAIITGENIYHYRSRGYSPLAAAVKGAREIATPITVSIITNMVAFLPLLFVPGMMGKTFGIIPIVVCVVFFISLIESLFVLPAHLTYKQIKHSAPKGIVQIIASKQRGFNHKFTNWVKHSYAPFLEKKVIAYRYLAVSIFIAILLGVGGFIFSGRMGMTLFPRVESDFAFATATLKVGSPYSEAKDVLDKLVVGAEKVIAENGGEKLSSGIRASIRENVAEVRVVLTEPEVRPISTAQFTNIWREKVGRLAGLESLSLESNRGGPGSGAALTVELSHPNTDVLDAAAIELAAALSHFPSTKDINDGAAAGKKQYDFQMKELGYALGFTTADVARQVRGAFYGSEALKQQEGRNEVRVLVRLPEHQRSSTYDIENMMIKSPSGADVMLKDIVSFTEGKAYTTINRRDGRRIITVGADVDPPSDAGRIIRSITATTLPNLQHKYQGLGYSFEGSQADIRESLDALFKGLFLVLFVIYAFLAVLFSSYTQPFMVLVAIPFGTIGAVAGHFLMGYSLSIMSLFGMMALAGVVINDSLILVNFANRKYKSGMNALDAIIEASIGRFRPIILTTLTTFMGLAPMMFETSRQAKFLIPMALSLGFGILFATLLTLVLIPALYMIVDDVSKLKDKFKREL